MARLIAAAAIVIGCAFVTVRPAAAGTELEIVLPPDAVAPGVAAANSVVGREAQPLESVGPGAEVVGTPAAPKAVGDTDAGTATVTESGATDGGAATSDGPVDVEGTVVSDSEPVLTLPAVDEAAPAPNPSAVPSISAEPEAQLATSTPSPEPKPAPVDPMPSGAAPTGIDASVRSTQAVTREAATVRPATRTDAPSASQGGEPAPASGPSTSATTGAGVTPPTGLAPLNPWAGMIAWSSDGAHDGTAAHERPMNASEGMAVTGAGLALAGQRVSAVSVAVDFARSSGGWAGPLVFNTWLRRQLRERRMSQRHLGMLSGVNHSAISRLINGHASPTLETATKLVHALHMEWTDDQIATYFDLLPEYTLLPTQRVESALRGDGTLGEDDVKAVMHHYLALRTRRRRGLAPTERGERRPVGLPPAAGES